MVFSSPLFLFFYLPVVLLVYYISPLKWRNAILLVFNLIFYGWGEPVYVLLMFYSTFLDYFCGRMIERRRESSRNARTFLLISIIGNLGILIFFKYLDFIILNLQAIPLFAALKPLGITLPIGISFYTFQTMSYTIDVYRGNCNSQRSIITFGTYVTLFPQLIAGPIVKYKDVAEQLERRTYSMEQFSDGVAVFTVGLAKKLLLANSIGALWEAYNAMPVSSLTTVGAWLGALAFTFQIYFDFSGYSDMAIGLGRMLGFSFLPNFLYPYTAVSITDFWRKWHVSLSSWFKEYLYIPLGGSRCSKPRWFFNIMVVWLATGIWHGAAWNFIIWGLYFGILLILEKAFLLRLLEHLPRFFRHAYTLFFVIVSWVIFATSSTGQCLGFLSAMLGGGAGFWSGTELYYLRSYFPMLIVLSLASLPFWAKRFIRLTGTAKTVCTLLLVIVGLTLCTACLVDSTYNPFLYFRF